MIGTQNFSLTAPLLGLHGPALRGSDAPKGANATEKVEVPENIRKAADGFESLFVAQLLAPLEESSQAMFGEGPEGRTISGLYREQLSSSIAKARPLGVANLIEKELLARQAALLDVSGQGAAMRSERPANGLASHATELYRKAMS